MKLTKKDLCLNRPYINLKKLPLKVSFKEGKIDEKGFKNTYIIDQEENSISKNENYTIEYSNGSETHTYFRDELEGNLLVEVTNIKKGESSLLKYKVYLIEEGIKYALPLVDFKEVYKGTIDILSKEVKGGEELNYILSAFESLEEEDFPVDISLNLERLSDYKDKVDYKRNVNYFVINNIPQATSKYDIKTNIKEIAQSDNIFVLRYDYKKRLYHIVETEKVLLKETDIIVDLTDEGFPMVSIFTNFGLGKLLDLKNNVIPNSNTLSLFANIIDLDIPVLN